MPINGVPILGNRGELHAPRLGVVVMFGLVAIIAPSSGGREETNDQNGTINSLHSVPLSASVPLDTCLCGQVSRSCLASLYKQPPQAHIRHWAHSRVRAPAVSVPFADLAWDVRAGHDPRDTL